MDEYDKQSAEHLAEKIANKDDSGAVKLSRSLWHEIGQEREQVIEDRAQEILQKANSESTLGIQQGTIIHDRATGEPKSIEFHSSWGVVRMFQELSKLVIDGQEKIGDTTQSKKDQPNNPSEHKE